MNERTCENLLQGDTADLHEALHAAFSALGIARVVRGARALAQRRPEGKTHCFLALAYGEAGALRRERVEFFAPRADSPGIIRNCIPAAQFAAALYWKPTQRRPST